MKSKSLGALEEICRRINNDPQFQEWCNTIQQDLKRKEELEKENQELKQDIVSFEDYSYDLDCEKELLEKENQELKDKIQVLEQSVKDTYDTSQEIIADLKEEKERWRKLCLGWREACIERGEKFHNLCKEVLGNGNTN